MNINGILSAGSNDMICSINGINGFCSDDFVNSFKYAICRKSEEEMPVKPNELLNIIKNIPKPLTSLALPQSYLTEEIGGVDIQEVITPKSSLYKYSNSSVLTKEIWDELSIL